MQKILTDDFKATVNEGEYFVMGDKSFKINRFKRFGCFTIDDIIVASEFVIFPLMMFNG